jgi:hypothetical protein
MKLFLVKKLFLKMELKYTENLIATLLGLYLKVKAGRRKYFFH